MRRYLQEIRCFLSAMWQFQIKGGGVSTAHCDRCDTDADHYDYGGWFKCQCGHTGYTSAGWAHTEHWQPLWMRRRAGKAHG